MDDCSSTPTISEALEDVQISGTVSARSTSDSSMNEVTLLGEWVGPYAGGNRNHATWRNNPQFLMRVAERTSVTITLTCLLDDQFEVIEGDGASESGAPKVGIYIARRNVRNKDIERKKMLMLERQHLAGLSEFTRGKSILENDLNPARGPYYIIPTTWHCGLECRFSLNIRCPIPFCVERIPENGWHRVHVTGAWSKETAGGCRRERTWRSNPQYHVKVHPKNSPASTPRSITAVGDFDFEEPTHYLFIVLSQPTSKNKWEQSSIGMYLAYADDLNRRKLTLKNSDICAKTKFEEKSEMVLDLKVRDSAFPYVLIPAMFQAGEIGPYTIDIFSNVEVSITAIDGKFDWYEKMVQGFWYEENSGGNITCASWAKNPSYLLSVPEDTVVIILLNQVDDGSIADLKNVGYYVLQQQLPLTASGDDVLPSRFSKNDKVVFESEFFSQWEVSNKLSLKGSETPYVIVPCTSESGMCAKYEMTIYSDRLVTLFL